MNYEPYRILSLTILKQSAEDNDIWYLRHESNDLKFWIDCAMLDRWTFQNAMEKRYPVIPKRRPKVAKTPLTLKRERNEAIILYKKRHPEASQPDIGRIFKLSWERVRKILKRGY